MRRYRNYFQNLFANFIHNVQHSFYVGDNSSFCIENIAANSFLIYKTMYWKTKGKRYCKSVTYFINFASSYIAFPLVL